MGKMEQKMQRKEKKKLKSQQMAQNDLNRMKARKMRLESNKNKNNEQRKNKLSKTLESIKKILTKQEYATFKSVLKLIQTMKSSNDQRQFDENVITPFLGLFGSPKRQYLFKELQRYIPKQFMNYYE